MDELLPRLAVNLPAPGARLDPAALAAVGGEMQARMERPSVKNPGAPVLFAMVVPAYVKVDENCRRRLEERRQLIADLRGPL